MTPYQSPVSQAETTGVPPADRSWFFTKLFAAIGFFAGGSVVFYIGCHAFNLPPPPPGQVACGNAVLAVVIKRAITIFFGTPLGAIVCSLLAMLIGALIDVVRHFFRQPATGKGVGDRQRGVTV